MPPRRGKSISWPKRQPMRRAAMGRQVTTRLAASRDQYAEARELVLVRDGFSCIVCDRAAEVTHHRSPRGMGGSSRDPDAHNPTMLVSLCRVDHDRVELDREEAVRNGWLIPMGVDPEDVPTLWHGTWCNLTRQGTVLPGAKEPDGPQKQLRNG